MGHGHRNCASPLTCFTHPTPHTQVIIEKYYNRLTQDFDTNKRLCEEIAVIQSKRLRNKIAGFTTVSGSPHACS